MLLKYFLKDFEKVPVAPIFTGVTRVFTLLLLLLLLLLEYYCGRNYLAHAPPTSGCSGLSILPTPFMLLMTCTHTRFELQFKMELDR
jgi:hypothetical protein